MTGAEWTTRPDRSNTATVQRWLLTVPLAALVVTLVRPEAALLGAAFVLGWTQWSGL